MRKIWIPILPVLSLPLGMRLALLYAYSLLAVKPYFIDFIDLPLIFGLVGAIAALTYKGSRPTFRQGIALLISGLVLAGLSAFAVLLIYSMLL